MTNDYIDYYDKYKISPVRQDLSDFDKHVYIRTMLYQALGLPKTAFKGKNVLEVGPVRQKKSLILQYVKICYVVLRINMKLFKR